MKGDNEVETTNISTADEKGYDSFGLIPAIHVMAHFSKVVSWNIYGHLAIKLEKSSLMSHFFHCDMVLVQETWLHDSKEHALPLRSSYDIITQPLSSSPSARGAWGGLAIIFHASLHLQKVDAVSTDFVLVA